MNNKTIWMCWFQGEKDESMPKLNRLCIQRWRELNPDWRVIVLSNETIKDYCSNYFGIIEKRKRSAAAHSDLIRILLLSRFGGVWVDASVYPQEPLSNFYKKIVNETGFFAYRFIPRGSYDQRKMCETTSWFLCTDRSNHPLIREWELNFIHNFLTFKTWPYFTFHETLTRLYDSNDMVRNTIENMVQIDEKIPHSAIKNWSDRKPSFVYKRPNLIF